ncbi:NAD(P)-binding domain-containing protein [Halobacteria archaeon AArc-curdl1]|uniref:NAD(P)-binding domain-containing protein n=1 Tax=Natronosalvus hydrolyticus TaxID=2979988 RepID=A0AAP3E8X2_9EURY|nr:NAD(P)-binding domain-containing protein [Halobacteria archaeon AArc-curdl1]
MTPPQQVDVAVVGAGAAGIGVGVSLSMLEIETVILERDEIGASFRRWPDEMRFITPSFPSNSFGLTDLNAVTPNTSPAVTLDREHPNGNEYANYLEAVADFHDLEVETGVEVTEIRERAEMELEDRQTTDQTAVNRQTTEQSTVNRQTAIPAGDGGTALETNPQQANDGGFVLETSEGVVHSKYVIWATGHFGSPRTDVFPGADACVHTSEIRSWAEHASSSSTDDFLIIGGYESGIDAAVALVEAGCRVRVLDRGEPWATRGPDPSEVLSPYTFDRLESVAGSDRLLVEGGAVVQSSERDADGCFEVRARAADGYELDEGVSSTYTVPTQPILATGFEPDLGPATECFPREDGVIELTSRDESPTTPGVFLAGPDVTHNGVKFCFIYKFRARFPIIAETIGDRLGVDTEPLEVYREQNMYLEDLSCCEPDMCDC